MKKFLRAIALVALATATIWTVWTFLTWFIIGTICEVLDMIMAVAEWL